MPTAALSRWVRTGEADQPTSKLDRPFRQHLQRDFCPAAKSWNSAFSLFVIWMAVL
jgi:hypothetical protein